MPNPILKAFLNDANENNLQSINKEQWGHPAISALRQTAGLALRFGLADFSTSLYQNTTRRIIIETNVYFYCKMFISFILVLRIPEYITRLRTHNPFKLF